ncbi:sugar transferase [Tunturiibacter lichenicola]|uniref:sugar transferase n=1 Tax=Tunturiibacter lichenicola TaxID=2051959 RepID=UPI0021B47A69|nr:sugar transferase [Edaphobacter lichenicola]
MSLLRMDKISKSADPLLEWPSSDAREVLSEEIFKRMIAVERKRTERSKEPFLLMLVEADSHQSSERNGKVLENILSVLLSSIRETDVIGWYKDRATGGVMFTGLTGSDKNSILSVILGKVSTTLRNQLTSDHLSQVSISFHFFPDNWDHDKSGRPSNPSLYPDLSSPDRARHSLLYIKQGMDIVGSALALTLCSPLLLVIALAIKASSKGPVLFRQQRVGQYGQCFTFLKFRSMHINNDNSVHKEYVTKLISGCAEHKPSNGNSKGIYKLTNDKRVTRIGKFLRRTSLDELPQLVNVLIGDMSLVGPRPAIPYEFAAYQTWHRRRVLEVKPGITGLWQVSGRSSVKFDEMVRLDLRYATSWSPWLDFKILMRTPRAVIGGAGAC